MSPTGKRRGPTEEVRQVLGHPFTLPHCAQLRHPNSMHAYTCRIRHTHALIPIKRRADLPSRAMKADTAGASGLEQSPMPTTFAPH